MEAVRREFDINDRGQRQIAIAIGVSLLIHLLALLIPWGIGIWEMRKPLPEKLTWIQVDPQSERERRIVQTEQKEKSATAPERAMLGAQNQKADRETVSRNRQIQAASSRPVAPARSKSQEESSSLAKFGLPVLQPKAPKPPEQQEAVAPSQRAFDYLPGVKEGDRTVLNTKEFVFYGYFQRIRRRLDQAWIPLLREKLMRLYRSGRQLASDMDHTTRVLVILSTGGEITKVLVLNESGSEELDDAAVKAFNKAGPFPNPPRGLVDEDGEVKIPWDFVLSTK